MPRRDFDKAVHSGVKTLDEALGYGDEPQPGCQGVDHRQLRQRAAFEKLLQRPAPR